MMNASNLLILECQGVPSIIKEKKSPCRPIGKLENPKGKKVVVEARVRWSMAVTAEVEPWGQTQATFKGVSWGRLLPG